MRALPLVAAILALSAVASADPPTAPSPAGSGPRPRRAPPALYNPALGTTSPPPSPTSIPSPPPPPGNSGAAAPLPAPASPAAAGSPAAAAASPAAPPPSAPRKRAKPRPRKPAPPLLPPPALKLTIDAPAPETPWLLRVENTGTTPLRIAADARLLAMDITPAEAAGGKHAITCELPREMRPQDDEDRSLVLPPGRAFTEALDPRLFCFDTRNAAALVPGAAIVPRLIGSRDVAAVAPVGEGEPVVATEHEWTGTPSQIGPAVAAVTKGAQQAHGLTLSTSPFVDGERASDVALGITATNESNAPVIFLLRPETITLDITGPSGVGVTDPSPTVHCAWSGPPPPPIRDLFTHLAPKGSDSLSVLPSEICPEDTLAHPGLYLVRAKLDTRRVSGKAIGLHTFDGEIVSETTTRIRVRELTGKPSPPTHPRLQPITDH